MLSTRVRHLLSGHPVATTAVVALLVAVAQLWWVGAHRPLGVLNTDEANYTAATIRVARELGDGNLRAAIAETGATTPVVPLVAAAAIVVSGEEVTAPMVVPLGAAAFCAVAAAAITRRIAGNRTGLVAGVIATCVPGMLTAVRSFGFAFPATAWLMAALWALFASDGGRRRSRLVAAGAFVGAMTVTRTMTVAFLPALVAAAVIELRGRRGAAGPVAANVVAAAATALAVSAPWWWRFGADVGTYLLDAGYGERAAGLGDDPFGVRILMRLLYGMNSATFLVPLTAVVITSAVTRSFRDGRRPFRGAWSEPRRHRAALALLVGYGFVITSSTQNGGWLNEVPFVYAAVALVASLAPLAGRRARRLFEVAGVSLSVVVLALALTDAGSRPTTGTPMGVVRIGLYGGTHSRLNQLSAADPRIRTPLRVTAAAEWWQASVATIEILERRSPRRPVGIVGGYHALVNPGTINLAGELVARRAVVLETAGGIEEPAVLRRLLSSDTGVLVFILARTDQLGGREPTLAAHRTALASGWRDVEAVPLPDGGTIRVAVASTRPAPAPAPAER